MATTFQTQSLTALIRKLGLRVSPKGHFGTGVSIFNHMSGSRWDRGYAQVECSYGSSWYHDETGTKGAAMMAKLYPALVEWAGTRGLKVERGIAVYTNGVKEMRATESCVTITPGEL